VSYNDERKQIHERLESQISDIPVSWPNTSFTPEPDVTWVKCNIVNGDSFQVTIGSGTNAFRHIGLIVIQVFSPLNKGNGEVLALADSIASIFRNWCGTTVSCKAPSVKDIGPDGHGWYQVNVSIPFHRDELL
jgi:hypothetical protein